MAFKIGNSEEKNYDNIESMFWDIRTKKINALYSHQAELLKQYQATFLKAANVAIELPTGSGKTLIGLLIGEYLRRKNGFKVLFLCSTNQLVNQVAALSNDKYGIRAIAFTGSKTSYLPQDKTAYSTNSAIAVTNYSSLFNVNPFFKDPDIIILDDVHVAENYIAGHWSLQIERKLHEELYLKVLSILRNGLEYSEHARLSDSDVDPMEINTVQLILSHVAFEYHNAIHALFNEVLDRDKTAALFYPWQTLKDHLASCQIYISWKSILVRPIVPPSLTIPAFRDAAQRIFMSATLGSGGDLERILGIKKIDRIPLPVGWNKQGSGRRFFVFPELALSQDQKRQLFVEANRLFGRSLSLLPDGKRLEDYKKIAERELNFTVFDATSIEQSKSTFVATDNAVALVANRYEGIDFEGPECRLLFVINFPRTTNLQETFIYQRMGSMVVLMDRIRTRIVQAVGRCTRGPSDYSCVIVMGEDISEYFVSSTFRGHFHPELQAEIEFGIEQSREEGLTTIMDNMKLFEKQGDEWREAENAIYRKRNSMEQEPILGSFELSNAVSHEVDYQYQMWNRDYEEAVKSAQLAINKLSGGSELNGYRGFWNYLAAVAAFLAHKEFGLVEYDQKSRHFLNEASKCSRAISWLRKLSTAVPGHGQVVTEWDENLVSNIERLEEVFVGAGVSNTIRFEKELAEIEDGLKKNDAKTFERAQQRLGEYLGFVSIKSPEDGAPDPYWISNGKVCFVFEDYTDNSNDQIPIIKLRQSGSHTSWIKENAPGAAGLEVVCIMVTNASTIDSKGRSFIDDVYYWRLSDFRAWTMNALVTIRHCRASFVSGSTTWREMAMNEFVKAKLDPHSIFEIVKQIPLKNL